MIERVAKALCEGEDQMVPWKALPTVDPDLYEDYLERARTAIEAMREPTEAMLRAFHDGPLGADEHEMDDKARAWLTEGWQAMIDSALTPPAKGEGGV